MINITNKHHGRIRAVEAPGEVPAADQRWLFKALLGLATSFGHGWADYGWAAMTAPGPFSLADGFAAVEAAMNDAAAERGVDASTMGIRPSLAYTSATGRFSWGVRVATYDPIFPDRPTPEPSVFLWSRVSTPCSVNGSRTLIEYETMESPWRPPEDPGSYLWQLDAGGVAGRHLAAAEWLASALPGAGRRLFSKVLRCSGVVGISEYIVDAVHGRSAGIPGTYTHAHEALARAIVDDYAAPRGTAIHDGAGPPLYAGPHYSHGSE